MALRLFKLVAGVHTGKGSRLQSCRKARQTCNARRPGRHGEKLGLDRGADFLPQLVPSMPRSRGIRDHPCMGRRVREVLQSTTQSIAGKFVRLGPHDQSLSPGGIEKRKQLFVIFLRRHIDIHQRQAQRQSLSLLQVRLDERRPTGSDFFRDLGIAVSRQISENQLWLRFSRPAYFEKIDRARASGSGTCLRNFCPQQRIDYAGFPHVRSSEECNFRQGRGRKLVHRHCRTQESGEDAHNSVWIFCKEVASATVWGAEPALSDRLGKESNECLVALCIRARLKACRERGF